MKEVGEYREMLFRRKKRKYKHKETEKQRHIDKNITIYDNNKFIDNEIRNRRRNIYTIPGVEKADFQPEMIKRQTLTRPIGKMCPECAGMLYNTKLDGSHFYCPNCERQFHKSEIK